MSDSTDRMVEAALFMAGKPITVKEIEEAQGLDQRTVRSAINRLIRKYEEGDTAIEIAKQGAKYSMQVKGEYRQKAEGVATPEISKEVLKVASLIGYYQPIMQSKLATLAGPMVYKGVKELVDLGMVKAKQKGQSFELTTTSKFIEYFGINAKSRAEVKHWFKEKLHAAPSKD